MTLRIGGVVGALVLVVAACGGSADETTTSSTTTAPPATSSTTVAPTTTTVVETTTTMETTTSAAPTTTSTTSAPGALQLTDEGVAAGATWVPFGTLDEETISAFSAVLGSPSDDSGWVDSFSVYGTCPGPVVRGVHWGSFVALFTQAETDFWTVGVPHFFAWYYTAVPPELATTEGLEIGSTIQDLSDLYGGPDLIIDESPFDPTSGYWSYDLVGWTGLWGYADGIDPASTITSVNGGRGCGE